MTSNIVQQNLINLGVSANSMVLLLYLRENFWKKEIKISEIKNRNPMFFKTLGDVRTSLNDLKEANILQDGEIEKTSLVSFSFSPEILDKIFGGEVVTLPRVKRVKENKQEESNEVKELVMYYNTFERLPRPATLTLNVSNAIKFKLKTLSIDEIKDGIEYASRQEWLINRAEAVWCNLFWVINNIEGFCSGGKYRSKKDYSKPVVQSSSTVVL